MHDPTALTAAHLRTYNTIFQHPISHNLKWHDVHALFRELGQVEEETNGNLKVTRNGRTLVLHPSRSKDVSEMEEIMSLRHFIERTEKMPPETNEDPAHCLVVIDHHGARIFSSEMHGAVPQHILPPRPEDYFRHAENSKDSSRGREKPDPDTFFEPIAAALLSSSHILIFGAGTGMSSEMDQLIAWLKIHRPAVAARIIGSMVVDEHHLTEDQLLAKAREFYAHRPLIDHELESTRSPLGDERG